MTRDELKLITLEDLPKLFNSSKQNDSGIPLLVSTYPIIVDNPSKDRYELKSYWIWPTIFKRYLSEDRLTYWEFIDRLFDKHNIVELLTDLDDSMVPSTIVTCGKVVDINILRKKYSYKEIVFAGYESIHNVDPETDEAIGRGEYMNIQDLQTI